MDYLKGYRVFREDPEWGKKLLVGAVLLFSTVIVPILGQVVLVGWQALMMRRAVHGQDAPLPRLDFDFQYLGKLVGTGFKGFIVRFVWTLPMILPFLCMPCVVFGLAAAEADDELAILCCAAAGLVMLPLVVLLGIPASVAAMRAELTDDLNQGLRFREVLEFSRTMFRPLLFGSLLLFAVSFGLSLLGLLACYVGAFFAATLAMIAHAHFMAQVYRAWLAQGGEALPLGPTEVDVPAPPSPGAPPPAPSSSGFPG